MYVHRRLHCSVRLATEPLPAPTSAGGVKVYPPKIELLVKDISNLTLLETSQLNELLKVGLPLAFVLLCFEYTGIDVPSRYVFLMQFTLLITYLYNPFILLCVYVRDACVCVYAYIRVCAYACMYVLVCMYVMCVLVYMYVCVYVCVYVCMCMLLC